MLLYLRNVSTAFFESIEFLDYISPQRIFLHSEKSAAVQYIICLCERFGSASVYTFRRCFALFSDILSSFSRGYRRRRLKNLYGVCLYSESYDVVCLSEKNLYGLLSIIMSSVSKQILYGLLFYLSTSLYEIYLDGL